MALCIVVLKLELNPALPHYVSYTTSIFTGLHGTCLLVVTTWFIYQLKHDSVWAGWIRIAMRPIITFAGLIIVLVMGWVKAGMRGVRTVIVWLKAGVIWIRKLYDSYKRNLHLQRNILWYAHCLKYPNPD